MSERLYPPGVLPIAFVAFAALAVLVGALFFGLTRGAPVAHPSPAPASFATAIATSSAAVTASQSVRVTIRRPARPSTSHKSAAERSRGPGDALQADLAEGQDEEVVIELTQAVAATAASDAQASASAPAEPMAAVPEHGRLGVTLSTMPGVVALDVQLAQGTLPAWLFGAPLEVGLDVQANHLAAGAGLSVGSKAFASLGGYSQWDLASYGVYGALGMRF